MGDAARIGQADEPTDSPPTAGDNVVATAAVVGHSITASADVHRLMALVAPTLVAHDNVLLPLDDALAGRAATTVGLRLLIVP